MTHFTHVTMTNLHEKEKKRRALGSRYLSDFSSISRITTGFPFAEQSFI